MGLEHSKYSTELRVSKTKEISDEAGEKKENNQLNRTDYTHQDDSTSIESNNFKADAESLSSNIPMTSVSFLETETKLETRMNKDDSISTESNNSKADTESLNLNISITTGSFIETETKLETRMNEDDSISTESINSKADAESLSSNISITTESVIETQTTLETRMKEDDSISTESNNSKANSESESLNIPMTTASVIETETKLETRMKGDDSISTESNNSKTNADSKSLDISKTTVSLNETEETIQARILQETANNINFGIEELKNELRTILTVKDDLQNVSKSVAKEATQKSIKNFFRSISSSINVFQFHVSGQKDMSSVKSFGLIETAASILNTSETASAAVASMLEVGTKVEINYSNISMTIMKRRAFEDGHDISTWSSNSIEVNLPDQEAIIGSDSSITVSFTAFENIGPLILLDESFSSSVLSINVIGAQKTEGMLLLEKPLVFSLYHRKLARYTARKCVYWDFQLKNWADQGCFPDNSLSTENITVCKCFHLTNFAVLVDIHDIAHQEEYKQDLDFLTFIGCSVSLVSLIVCLGVFSTFRSARNERSAINFNICFCLFVSELVFLFGINQTSSSVICFGVALVLHYFFLAAFFWMLVAGFQIYVLLIEVFEQDSSRKVQYYMIGYITPLLIVLSSLLFDTLLNESSVYGSNRFCWISSPIQLIISFITPTGLIMLANTYFLGVAGWKIHQHYTSSPHIQKSRATSLKSYIQGLLGLMSLLGVTWTVGLFSISYPSPFLTYAFTCLNSLQGKFKNEILI